MISFLVKLVVLAFLDAGTVYGPQARDTLLVYASVIRHGLCPNLLDAANRPRYNARDATWFFMQAENRRDGRVVQTQRGQ